jgi:hypothetical protein
VTATRVPRHGPCSTGGHRGSHYLTLTLTPALANVLSGLDLSLPTLQTEQVGSVGAPRAHRVSGVCFGFVYFFQYWDLNSDSHWLGRCSVA